MKENRFIYCNNKLEIISKTALKGKSVNVLYCIVDGIAHVFQGFKVIEISDEQFAEGLEIDLLEAKAILSGEATTIETAKEFIEMSRKKFEETVETAAETLEEKIDSLGDLSVNHTYRLVITPDWYFDLNEGDPDDVIEVQVRDLQEEEAMRCLEHIIEKLNKKEEKEVEEDAVVSEECEKRDNQSISE